ncbi:MAG TPA: cytochrome c [Rhizomicrobium sp.]|nr:cytochrome c [Rhizomicrobium sp.]
MKFLIVLLAFAAWALPARAQDQIARGAYLAVLGDCAGCHSAAHKPAFSGGLPFTASFGTVFSTNITPDKDTGIGNWSKAQFYRALHQGIAADGHHLYPAFPYVYFTRISRQDTDALFAYLKSVKPVHRPPTPNRLMFPFNIRAVMIFWNRLFLDDKRFVPDPKQTPEWNRGAYIVNGLGHCAACHTPKNIMFGDEDSEALTGTVLDNWFAANLTGSAVGGLGKWSHADLVHYFATGRNRYATAAGSMQEKVTLSLSHLTDADRDAIATYLKSLPPRKQPPPRSPDAEQMARGEAVFVNHCAICHQSPQNQPQPPDRLADYPQLPGDTLVLGRDPTTVVRIILEGALSPVTTHEHTTYSMPSFAALSNRDIADVATYLRNAWGNHASPVSPSRVRDLRRAIAGEPQVFTVPQ